MCVFVRKSDHCLLEVNKGMGAHEKGEVVFVFIVCCGFACLGVCVLAGGGGCGMWGWC